jgi:hypothetical protein
MPLYPNSGLRLNTGMTSEMMPKNGRGDDVDLGIAEEPEQVLPQDRPAVGRVEHVRPEVPVGDQPEQGSAVVEQPLPILDDDAVVAARGSPARHPISALLTPYSTSLPDERRRTRGSPPALRCGLHHGGQRCSGRWFETTPRRTRDKGWSSVHRVAAVDHYRATWR